MNGDQLYKQKESKRNMEKGGKYIKIQKDSGEETLSFSFAIISDKSYVICINVHGKNAHVGWFGENV
jgi:hypothetical protein